MDYFESEQNFLKTLRDKLGDADLADSFIEKISSIGDRHSLTLGETGEIFNILDKIVKGETNEDELLENLLSKLGVTEEEILEVTVDLEELLEQLKEIEPTAKELKEIKNELEKRETRL